MDKAVSHYHMESVTVGSAGFYTHQRVVSERYVREGFISPEASKDITDEYDTQDAIYCLLRSITATDELAGTFRILPGNTSLPLFAAFPYLPVEGVLSHLCESTRVVSLKRSLAGRSDPTHHVLFETVLQSVAYVRAHSLLGVISLGSPVVFQWINATFFGCQRALAAPRLYSGGMVIPSIIWADEFERVLKHGAMGWFELYQAACRAWKKT